MAPFHKAVHVQDTLYDGEYKSYAGEIDPEWVIGAIPNGGYVLALLVNACIQYQAASSHRDPVHVTAHYLRTSIASRFEIRVRTVRNGRSFTNLTAELYQQGILIITTHQIFGVNTPPSSGLSLAPASSYARRIPLYTHPSTAVIQPLSDVWKFRSYVDWAPDDHILAKNAPDHPNRADSSTIGGDGLEWGAWFAFKDKSDKVMSPMLALLVDIFINIPSLLPPSERPGLGTSWFPTVVLAIEFKAPLPRFSASHANRTVGLYSSGKFLNDGRHDAYVEVWTAPCNLGEGSETSSWREEQVCLAIATQMAYIIPMGVNLERGKKKEVKL
ncbi:hypothetical protein D9615_002727 [Tricholomella constricta]|uniref:Thioesterase-like superfamily-domain-containing protein n=1 Tax=Tricholomella constricta TaxID=117010 RepID=A0A8H5M644_9AGAR|nr:hypothetical protein D9615_002727 [Tricholomella constricta]